MFDIPTGGTASLLALQYRLLQTQSLPADQHKNLQSTSLQKLLNHAINTVPFYRDYPEYKEVNDASELSKLPILTRKTLHKKCPAPILCTRLVNIRYIAPLAWSCSTPIVDFIQ